MGAYLCKILPVHRDQRLLRPVHHDRRVLRPVHHSRPVLRPVHYDRPVLLPVHYDRPVLRRSRRGPELSTLLDSIEHLQDTLGQRLTLRELQVPAESTMSQS